MGQYVGAITPCVRQVTALDGAITTPAPTFEAIPDLMGTPIVRDYSPIGVLDFIDGLVPTLAEPGSFLSIAHS
jgi:hypothetical protein